jgi:hypothetical protein
MPPRGAVTYPPKINSEDYTPHTVEGDVASETCELINVRNFWEKRLAMSINM